MIKTVIKHKEKTGPLSHLSERSGLVLSKFRSRFKHDRKFRAAVLAGVIGVISISVILAAVVCFSLIKTADQVAATDNTNSDVITFSTDNPGEEPPGTDFVWKGGANDPKAIRLTSVGIEGYIQKVGVDQNTQIAVPNNVHFAGWFVNTVRPGEPGLSIIDGHLNGTSRGGIFRNLNNIAPGAQFEVEMGDGSVKVYRVKEVLTVDLDKSAEVLFSQQPGIKSQLNLITCGGTYNKEQRFYQQRVIVIAEYLSSM
jgi:LPXTG-site transpeptidase (sortase) family protein